MINIGIFQKNINLIHLATVSGNEVVILRTMKGLLNHFPDKKEELEHFCFFTNFGLLEGFEMSIEEFYEELIK